MPVASVGDEADSTLEVTIDGIEAYAALTGDENPIHLDHDYARETRVGGRVAHGLFAAGAIGAAIAALPGDVIYLSQDLEFENPVAPGDTVVAEVEVVETLRGDRVRIDTTARVGDRRVIDGEAVVLSVPHED